MHHFKMCIYHPLCRYINKIVLFKHLVIANNLICAFHPEASKHLAKWKILLLSCQCFGSWNTEKFSVLSRASGEGGRRDTWSSQTLVHCAEHWFIMVHSSLCSPHTLYGVRQNSLYNYAGLMDSRGTKTAQICIDWQKANVLWIQIGKCLHLPALYSKQFFVS